LDVRFASVSFAPTAEVIEYGVGASCDVHTLVMKAVAGDENMKLAGWFDTVGSALLAQLMFFVFAVPVVTALPAAVAMQRQLSDHAAGEKIGVMSFAREFARAWRSAWVLGIVAPVVVIGFAVSILFWYSQGTTASAFAFGFLVCLAGLTCAFYLVLLWASDRDRPDGWRTWCGAALSALLRRAPRILWALVLMIAWLTLAAFAIPLLLVGSGLVPALIVYFTLTERRAKITTAPIRPADRTSLR
jgi:hypothetical protein